MRHRLIFAIFYCNQDGMTKTAVVLNKKRSLCIRKTTVYSV